MARFVTSIFLALILIDMAASLTPVADGHKPPSGLRRMIETLGNKDVGAYQCALEGMERGMITMTDSKIAST